MMGKSGERGSGISVRVARHDGDDDEIMPYIQRSLKKFKASPKKESHS